LVNKALLLFVIGPVQPFIEQARKTRDLWLGSYVLSKLMEAALEGLGEALVFPAEPWVRGRIPDLPNKFVAIFDSAEDAKKAAERAEDGLSERWEQIAQTTWEYLFDHAPADDETRRIWNRQKAFATFFEVYWVVATEVTGERYGSWYGRAQEALEARKHLRSFPEQNEPGEKSTVSGEREALRGMRQGSESLLGAAQRFWRELGEKVSAAQITPDGRERLDTIDAIKRFAALAGALPGMQDMQEETRKALKDAAFPSTSQVAAASFVEDVLRKAGALEQELADWKTATDPERVRRMGVQPGALPYLHSLASGQEDVLSRDGQCFFPETFTAKRLAKDYAVAEEEAPNIARQGLAALIELRKAARDQGISPPLPYYAILKVDGDHMGTLPRSMQDDGEHRTLSAALSRFARSKEHVIQIVEHDYPARLVYAGGDDVLALVPLRSVLAVADALQMQYQQTVGAACPRAYQPEQITMSAGIAIAHYLDPLAQVLHEARQAEEEIAKERYGRNAVVVTLLRRSGEATTVGCKWHYAGLVDKQGQPDERGQPLRLFQDVAALLELGMISTSFVSHFAEEAATLSQLKIDAQESEIRRLLRRGSEFDGKRFQELDEEQRATLREQWEDLPARLARLADQMNPRLENGTKTEQDAREGKPDEVELWRPGPRRGLVEVSGWLVLMAFSLRERRD
jgi:CRISPR-associated protein Cmr2